MRHPSMTTRGTRIAFVLAVVIALALPKRIECRSPGGHCASRPGACTSYEIEPLAFYLVELAVDRNVGFAYETGGDCR